MTKIKEVKFILGFIFLLINLNFAYSQKALTQVQKASVTYYSLLDKGNLGNCSLINDSIKPFYVAVNNKFYNGLEKNKPAEKCGVCLQMTGEGGSATLIVVDRCPACKVGAHNEFDLSPEAYKKVLGGLSAKNRELYWRQVPCPYENQSIRIQVVGSNRWYVKVIIGGAVTKINSVQLFSKGTWMPLKRGNDNGWTIKGLGTSNKYDIRIIDRCGQIITISQIDVTKGNKLYLSEGNFKPCAAIDEGDFFCFSQLPIDSLGKIIPNKIFDNIEYVEICSLSGVVLDAFVLKYVSLGKIDFRKYSELVYLNLYSKGKKVKTLSLCKNDF